MMAIARCMLVATLLVPALARADGLELGAVTKQLEPCHASDDGSDPLAAVGAITRADPIGKRATTEAIQLVGKKSRAYVFFTANGCVVIPVVGKPAAYAKGELGGGKVAYVLRTPTCNNMGCPTAVTIKGGATTEDRALDAMLLPRACPDGVDLDRFAVFAGRDSLKLGCWGSSGADPDRIDYVIDTESAQLRVVAEVEAGVGWMQPPDETHPKPCQAKIPGGIAVAARGDKAAIDVSRPATEDEAKAAGVEHLNGGCDQTIATQREAYDATARKFAPTGKPKVTIARKLCKCR
jgi:hypothetical protein